MIALLLALAAQEEIKDGHVYVNRTHKIAFSTPAPAWGKLRIGRDLEWRWPGGVCELVEAKTNVCGCLAVEETALGLEEYVKQFEEGLKKNDGSKKLESKGEAKLPDGRLRRVYEWQYREWTLTYVAVFLPLEKKIAKLCLWGESRLWTEYEAAVNGIAESFRAGEPADLSPKKTAHSWTPCDEGSWVEETTRTKKAGEESKTVTRRTLVKKTADEFVFKIDAREVKEKAVAVAPPAPKEIGRGEEEIEIAGKKLKCRWTDTQTEKGTTRTWMCDDVPGGVAKSSSKGPDFETETVVTGFEKK